MFHHSAPQGPGPEARQGVAPGRPVPAKPAPPTTYRPAPTSPKQRRVYTVYLAAALLVLVGGAFLMDATLEDEPQSLTVAEGMESSILTYAEWPLRFATLEDCHDAPGLGRPGVMELNCDGESYGITGLSGVDVQGGEEPIEHAVSRAVRAIVFQDGVELQSANVLEQLPEAEKAQLQNAEVKQLRVTQSYTLGEQRYVAVAFVQDPEATAGSGADRQDGSEPETQDVAVGSGDGPGGGAGTDPDGGLGETLNPAGAASMVVVQVPVKSDSEEEQLEEVIELVRGVRLDDAERAGEADV